MEFEAIDTSARLEVVHEIESFGEHSAVWQESYGIKSLERTWEYTRTNCLRHAMSRVHV